MLHRIQTINNISPLGLERFDASKFGVSEDTSEPCLLYTSPSPRDATLSRMPSSA